MAHFFEQQLNLDQHVAFANHRLIAPENELKLNLRERMRPLLVLTPSDLSSFRLLDAVQTSRIPPLKAFLAAFHAGP